MARPISQKVLDVRAKLVRRLESGLYRPGDRFLSTRAIAQQFNVSYQTAHRLTHWLCEQGHLVIRAQSGTYVPGEPPSMVGVDLLFHPRARASGTFGAKLLDVLTARLDDERIAWAVRGNQKRPALQPDRFPVLWEMPAALARCIRDSRSALIINDRPPFGMQSLFIDSVSTDDYSGGVCAAELLRGRRRSHSHRHTGFAVLAGPKNDTRSRLRVEGFRSLLKARVCFADGWYFEHGRKVAAEALRQAPQGLFCCNDRLAEAVVSHCREHNITPPPIVGFDDAPIAEQLDLTTIAIPWQELADHAVAVIRRRLAGDATASTQQIIIPRPLIRSSAAS